jgi:serine/threonine-protein kinase
VTSPAPLDDAAVDRLRLAFADLVDESDGSEGEAVSEVLEAIVSHPRYLPLERIGAGGMGTVYRCRDTVLQREVALKVVRSDTPGRQARLAARLEAEARIVARLEHAGIVAVHDAGQLDDGRAFYVMQRLRGRTLRAVLADDPTGHDTRILARRLDVFERITEAVAFAHEAGVVHRDLKPDNIMVGDFGEVHVTDWGVARVLAEVENDLAPDTAVDETSGGSPISRAVDHRLTDVGTVLGTPGFMAPEQAAGQSRTVGPTADVYALGGLLLAMLTGEADAPTREPLARIAALAAAQQAPRPLLAIARRCLSTEPSARYPNAAALLGDVRRYRSGDPVSAHRESAIEQLIRRLRPWRTALLLLVAYLVMRMAVAWIGSGRASQAGLP